MDRMGLIKDITSELSTIGANFTSFNAQASKDGTTLMKFIFQLSDISFAGKIADGLKTIDGVIDVYRASSGNK